MRGGVEGINLLGFTLRPKSYTRMHTRISSWINHRPKKKKKKTLKFNYKIFRYILFFRAMIKKNKYIYITQFENQGFSCVMRTPRYNDTTLDVRRCYNIIDLTVRYNFRVFEVVRKYRVPINI